MKCLDRTHLTSVPFVFVLATVGVSVLAGPKLPDGGMGESRSQARIERTYDSEFNPSHQRAVFAETEDVRISLKRKEECKKCPSGRRLVFEVKNKRQGTSSEFVLENEIAQVDELHAISPSKGAVIGREMCDARMVTIVEVKTGKLIDSFYCFRPSVSPNKELVAYEKLFPLHFMGGVSAEYLVYDFAHTPTENRNAKVPVDNRMAVGLPVFPPGSLNLPGDNITVDEPQRHTMASDSFFWSTDSKKIAFVDRSNAKNSFVVVDISSGVRTPIIWTKTLEADEIVDVAHCREYQDHPEFAFTVHAVTFDEKHTARFRLGFSSSNPACLKQRTLRLDLP